MKNYRIQIESNDNYTQCAEPSKMNRILHTFLCTLLDIISNHRQNFNSIMWNEYSGESGQS